MTKRVLYLCALLLCCAEINCKHVIAKETKIEELEISSPADCKPKPTYVKWSEVRMYLNEYFKMRLPLSVTGVDLVVNRCRCFLAPCQDGNTYCGVVKETKKKVRIPLEYDGDKIAAVVVTFLEDHRCDCFSKEWYGFISQHDVIEAPVILEASLDKY